MTTAQRQTQARQLFERSWAIGREVGLGVPPPGGLRTKNLPADLAIKAKPTGGWRLTGRASHFGLPPDLLGDVISPGAYDKTLKAHGGRFPLLWSHDAAEPLGTVTARSTAHGLEIDAALSKTARSADVAQLVADRVVRGLSIGFRVVRSHVEKGFNYLDEIDLREVSVVLWPANPHVGITGVEAKAAHRARARRVLAEAALISAGVLAETA